MEDKKEVRKFTIKLNVENNHNMEIGNSLLDWEDVVDSTGMTDEECQKYEEEMKKPQEQDDEIMKNVYAQKINNLLLALIKKGASKELITIISNAPVDAYDIQDICVAYQLGMPEKYILKMIELDTKFEVDLYIKAWSLYKNEEMLDVLAQLDDSDSMYIYMSAYARKMKPENLKQLASLDFSNRMEEYYQAYFMKMPQKHLDVMADSTLGHKLYMEAYFIGMPEEKLEIFKNLFGCQFYFYYDAYLINMDDKNIERGLDCDNPSLFMKAYRNQMSDEDLERLTKLSSDNMELYIKARLKNFDEDAIDELYKLAIEETPETIAELKPYKFYENYCYSRSSLDSVKKELIGNYDEYDEESINQIFKTKESYKNIKIGNVFTKKIFNINDSEITIKFGNLFEEEGIKIIPANDSFDTQVDEVIVSSKTIHGMFINNIIGDKFDEFKNDLDKNLELQQENFDYHNEVRNAMCYKIGTCVEIIPDEYVMVAFSKFDDNHKAYLSSEDYDQCMDKMWTELCKLNIENKTIILPIMGSGVTQLFGDDFNQNDLNNYYTALINKMIKPLKDRKLPDNTKISILIYDGLKDKIALENLIIEL